MVNIIEYRKMKTGINTINHPGRDQSLQYIDYHSAPATPPSKGGENIIALNFTIIIRLTLLILHVNHFQTP